MNSEPNSELITETVSRSLFTPNPGADRALHPFQPHSGWRWDWFPMQRLTRDTFGAGGCSNDAVIPHLCKATCPTCESPSGWGLLQPSDLTGRRPYRISSICTATCEVLHAVMVCTSLLCGAFPCYPLSLGLIPPIPAVMCVV